VGLIATPILAVLTLAVSSGSPASRHFAPHAAVAVAAAAVSRERPAKAYAMPVVAYSAESLESFDVASHAADAVGGFTDAETYAAFAPERIERAAKPHETLLARMRRAASRVLALTASLPHF
jgi:hypothetical protein